MALTTPNEFINALSNAQSVKKIHEICSRFCHQNDFDNFIYGAIIPTSFVQPSYIAVSGYPKEWRRRYFTEGYLCVDPIVEHCTHSTVPIDWIQIRHLEKENKAVQSFMNEARDFGLRSGVTFPVRTAKGESALFSASSGEEHDKTEKNIQHVMPAAFLFTAHLHEAVLRVFKDASYTVAQVPLTRREKQCLLWAAEGKTSWETAKILSISERTVIFHFKNAAVKLDVVNRQQAVARAISTGQITPQFS